MAFVMLILMNMAVMASIYMTIFLLEVFFNFHLDKSSVNTLLIIALILGFGGSLFSLFMSKRLAIMSEGVEVINTPTDETQKWLVDTVEKLAKKAGIGMPDVGIFDGPPNAFATGWNKNNALVAVSISLFDMMNKQEVEGVLAHEISHIKNGDMVTMTIVQGVLNSLVFFLSRVIAKIVAPKDEEGNVNIFAYMAITFVLELLLSVLASILAMWFSRFREYRADEGAVDLSGPEGIYYSLAKLGEIPKEQLALPKEMKAFGIVGFFDELFSTHPPIEKRLNNIKEYANQKGVFEKNL